MAAKRSFRTLGPYCLLVRQCEVAHKRSLIKINQTIDQEINFEQDKLWINFFAHA